MKKIRLMQAVALTMGAVMSLGVLSACKDPDNPNPNGGSNRALVIMSEELNNLYNPFYSTAGTDMDVVGQTQLGMLTTDSTGTLVCGEDEATVALAWSKTKITGEDGQPDTQYDFVIKNGIKFSDGVPLTINDVLFNLYVYLDPAYTGSTTMYSTDIVGLQNYRTQRYTTEEGEDDKLTVSANGYAQNRIDELVNIFHEVGKTNTANSYSANESKMKSAIAEWTISEGYKTAIGETNEAAARTQLLQDYTDALTKFKEELNTDFGAAKEAFTEEPYKSAPIYYQNKQVATGFDEVVSFMFMEGFATPKYPVIQGSGEDRTQLERVELDYNYNAINTQETAVNHVYESTITDHFDQVMLYWATGTQLRSEFVAKAKDVLLHEGLDSGENAIKSISGIQSLGHHTDLQSVTVDGKDYPIAQEHNDDGTPKNEGEYDVLRIVVNGVDPKAEWNFSFSVAPYHYYSDPSKYKMDPENEEYGVSWADFNFQVSVIQGVNSWGQRKTKIPLGAGPYVASDINDSTQPKESDFVSGNTVYFVSNPNFLLGEPKIKRMHYQVVGSSNALNMLETGSVHFVTPQFTKANADYINNTLKGKGFNSVATWQLGYGYIGINAGFVPNIHIRRAIMAAMNVKLCLGYYTTGTVANIYYPMSLVSWAYPREEGYQFDAANPLSGAITENGRTYMQYTSGNVSAGEEVDKYAIQKIRDEMALAGVMEHDDQLKIKFTIAGSSMTEHPAYAVFKQAMDTLNKCGWEVTMQPDPSALTKLSTGSLAVWAAAWGSTIDPDMYQVYHKNSTATSTYAWGYREILGDTGNTYSTEKEILNDLAVLIDQARLTDEKDVRTPLYKQAMDKVLELAVEMPLYQRQTLYAYNTKVIKESSLPTEINPYTSPLAKIWEIELV